MSIQIPRRKLHGLSTNLGKSVGDLDAVETENSIGQLGLFLQGQIDRHTGKSGKRISGDNNTYRSVPTGWKEWLKPYLEGEYLNDIQTNYDY